MEFEVSISNYRCFSDPPVRFTLKDGLQSFVGINNSGKTCLLRMFYELRNLFALFAPPGPILNALSSNQAFNQMSVVKDPEEIFHDRNARDLVIGFEMKGNTIDGVPIPRRFEITIQRGSNQWRAKIQTANGLVLPDNRPITFAANQTLIIGNSPVVTVAPLAELGSVLSRTLYVGPFRNAVNIGGSGDYYDVQIGEPFISQWRLQKTGYNKKRSESTYRLMKDIERIFGFQSLDINASDDGKNLQLMIDGKVGAGLFSASRKGHARGEKVASRESKATVNLETAHAPVDELPWKINGSGGLEGVPARALGKSSRRHLCDRTLRAGRAELDGTRPSRTLFGGTSRRDP